MGKSSPKISTKPALDRVKTFCETVPSVFYDASSLYNAINFKDSEHVTQHGLAQALSLAASYGDPHGYLRPVSQIYLQSDSSLQSKFGVFYGYRRCMKPGHYSAIVNPQETGMEIIDLDFVSTKCGEDKEHDLTITIVGGAPYEELKKKPKK